MKAVDTSFYVIRFSFSRSFTLNETAHYFSEERGIVFTRYSPNTTTQDLQFSPGNVIDDSGGNAPAVRRGLKRHQRKGRKKNDNGFKKRALKPTKWELSSIYNTEI